MVRIAAAGDCGVRKEDGEGWKRGRMEGGTTSGREDRGDGVVV